MKLSEDVASNFIAVARVAEKVPELAQAVEDGLSISKARKITPVLKPENKEAWIEKVQTLTYRELDREIAKERPELTVKETIRAVAEDRVRVELGLSEATAAKLREAQHEVSRSLGHNASLEETLEALLAAFAPKEVKTRSEPKPDAQEIPAATLRAVDARDGRQCTATTEDGARCTHRRWLHVHHIRPRALGGGHELSNLATLCTAHHRQVHATRRATGASCALTPAAVHELWQRSP